MGLDSTLKLVQEVRITKDHTPQELDIWSVNNITLGKSTIRIRLAQIPCKKMEFRPNLTRKASL